MSSVRDIKMGDLTASREDRDDGSILIRCDQPLAPYPRTMVERLIHWATEKPDQTFIAQRDTNNPDQWIRLSYRETYDAVRRIASALVDRKLSVQKPIAILSGNDINHCLLSLAAMYVGVPYAPISPQYSLVSKDFEKLKVCLNLITPGMVFVDDAGKYRNALKSAVLDNVLLSKDTEIVAVTGALEDSPVTLFQSLLDTEIHADIDDDHKVDDKDIAKFLFTSGSTGSPKAVINTHKMLCANQQMILQALPVLADPAPVLVDWLPWNHTFGGNHNVGIVLYNGGTLYIDDGKPTPQGFLETIRNLKEISPTAFYNVPKGFEELVKHLKADEQLREKFFEKVTMFFYAGAGLSQPVWDALEELALETIGKRIMIVTGLGCTETAPSALFTTGDGGFAGWLGLPVPGVTVKLVPSGSKMEIRIKGATVTPGYWRQSEITNKAFDEEGYFCTGDAVLFTDPNDLQRGLVFDGRISEDFKLDTGTWVSAGPLRAQLLNHFDSLVKDLIVVGRDRPAVSALVFPDFDVCRKIADSLIEGKGTESDADLCANPIVKAKFLSLLESFSAKATGSSNKVTALSLQVIPPQLDAHEITDKGSLNAGAIQSNRAAEIDALYMTEENKDASPNAIVRLSE